MGRDAAHNTLYDFKGNPGDPAITRLVVLFNLFWILMVDETSF
jgi:hypothetical protein